MWDDDTRYAVIRGKDARYDGQFFTGVLTTGIYCRPSCPARTPARANVTFYPTVAAAQRAGFRSCRRCFPDDAPGSPRWKAGSDVASRAMRLIEDGAVEREGVSGLARRLGYTERHVSRVLVDELGASPQALAIAHRLHHARTLLQETSMSIADVAFAAGFGSVRQFNDAARAAWALTPTQVRGQRRASTALSQSTGSTRVELRLRYRAPADVPRALAFVGARAIHRVEWWDGTALVRTMRLPQGAATARLRAGDGHVAATLDLEDVRDLGVAVARCRRLLDLDADAEAVRATLDADSSLAPLVALAPGLRVPGAVDPFEMVVRAIVGQQVSVAGARRTLGMLAARFGREWGGGAVASVPGEGPGPGAGGVSVPNSGKEARSRGVSVPNVVFPEAEALADVDPAIGLVPRARWRAISAVARGMLDGSLDLSPGADRDEARRALLAVPGIGPWTAEYVALRALGDPDAFPASDLVLRRAWARQASRHQDGRDLETAARAWSPWHAYAALHLWTAHSEGRIP